MIDTMKGGIAGKGAAAKKEATTGKEATRLHQIYTTIPGAIETLTALTIHEAIGSHVAATVCVTLADEESYELIENLILGVNIEIAQKEDDILFMGMPRYVRVDKTKGVYTAEIQLVSHSFQLDIIRKRRSFQHTPTLCRAILQQIVSGEHQGRFYYGLPQEETQARPLIQYNETDWVFLTRLASHFRAPLTADARAAYPSVYFGLPRGSDYTIDSRAYQVEKSMPLYLTNQARHNDWMEEQSITYHFDTTENYQLGDKILYNSMALMVIEKTVTLTSGILVFRYGLRKEAGVRTILQFNPAIKYFENQTGKEMRLAPTDLTFTARDGAVFLNLDGQGGITINGSDGIEAHGTHISFHSYDITINGQEDITLQTTGSNINVHEEIYIWGDGGVSY